LKALATIKRNTIFMFQNSSVQLTNSALDMCVYTYIRILKMILF